MYLINIQKKVIISAFIALFTVGAILENSPQTASAQDAENRSFSLKTKQSLMTPILNQFQEITSNDGVLGDAFSFSVSIDGDTAVIGAPNDDDGGSGSGSAYVFIRSGATWFQQAKLNASDPAAFDSFGWSVSIDGDTVIVGAHSDDDDGPSSGSAYIFTRSGTTWSQQQKLTASDATSSARFGWSVSVDSDSAIIGATLGVDGGVSSGVAYIFNRSGTTWTQQAKLISSDAAGGDVFGESVSIDGNTVVVGAFGDNDGGSSSGSAYIFTRSGTIWTQQQKLTASDAAASDQFGLSVSISGDTVIAGALNDDDGGSGSGSAYVFTRSGTTWTQQQKLTASDAVANDQFGINVSIDGDTAVVGAYLDGDSGSQTGSAYVFTRSGGTWTESRKLIVSNGATNDLNGRGVSISGTTVITGAPFRDISAFSLFSNNKLTKNANLAGADQGAAYFFNLLASTSADASISGRVLSPNGYAIPSAVVYLTTQDGESITARTNQFGYFKFEGVEVGQTLVVNVFSKRYQFQPQVINLDDSITDLEIVADK